MSHQPSTSVKVPTSATTYSPATQDADLRSQINVLLLREGHAARIQEQLLHSLDAHSSNWPSAVQSHALSLLRSGEVSTFPALVRRVLEDVRRDTSIVTAPSSSSSDNTSSTNNNSQGAQSTDVTETDNPKDSTNGASASNGAGKTANGTASGADANLAIPTTVVDSVLKAVKESLSSICEVVDDASQGG
ncbi:hypothetical protein GGS21DRAFT_182890 [Xylaria nigripes]|nr:hypothetical protein GGS21DRAFT_182890 [Xylaria nigripes]